MVKKESVMKAKNQINWRIYYDDGSTFDAKDGKPQEAPATGVIAIVQEDSENGWVITAFKDYYWREHNSWWGGDTAGFWQRMFKGGSVIMKFGVSTTNDNFNKILARATEDQQQAIKSGKGLLEPGSDQEWGNSTKKTN
jgi:hypothetical protein